MTDKRMSTWQKATALVPLALLSGAWTASLAVSSATAADNDVDRLPDGTSLPAQAVQAPATVSQPGDIAPAVPAGAADGVVGSVSRNGIPSAALAAYQRAAQVIDSADPGCKVEWPLVAAIGRVESDHGRFAGNVLNAEGEATPGIYGIRLDGTNNTARITDTDAGQYDDDRVYDRAVGPMQFIPSTWSVVGVDGDGDGKRNPQDIDDAALATAVYLCSGSDDLSTRAGQEAAVYRYNHSNDYVDLVLRIAQSYESGDYTSVPTSTAAVTTFTPALGGSGVGEGPRGGHRPPKVTDPGPQADPGSSTPSGGSSSEGPGAPSSQPPSVPASGGSAPSGGGSDPVRGVGEAAGGVAGAAAAGVKEVLVSTAQATAMCTSELQSRFGSAPAEALQSCVSQLQGKTVKQAQATVGNVVSGLGDLVGSLLGGLLGGR